MAPFFSIIIPVYNVEPYLRECLDSVLGQTFTDWEAICVDDGSTDNSGAILDEYAAKDNRFKVIHQQNAGVSAARNRGLEDAKGLWISFIDSDDYVTDDYLSFFSSLDNKADLNFFNIDEVHPSGKLVHYKKKSCELQSINRHSTKLLYQQAFRHGVDAFGWTVNKFVRAHSIDGLKFDEKISFFEDELFWIMACEKIQTFQILDWTPYRYRIRGTGLTSRGRHDCASLADHFWQAGAKSRFPWIRALAFRRAITLTIWGRRYQSPFKSALAEFAMGGRVGNPLISTEYRFAILATYFRRNFIVIRPLARLYRRILKHGEFANN